MKQLPLVLPVGRAQPRKGHEHIEVEVHLGCHPATVEGLLQPYIDQMRKLPRRGVFHIPEELYDQLFKLRREYTSKEACMQISAFEKVYDNPISRNLFVFTGDASAGPLPRPHYVYLQPLSQ